MTSVEFGKPLHTCTFEQYDKAGFVTSACGRCRTGSIIQFYSCWEHLQKLADMAELSDVTDFEHPKPSWHVDRVFTTASGAQIIRKFGLSDEEYKVEIKHHMAKCLGDKMAAVLEAVEAWLTTAVQVTDKEVWHVYGIPGYESAKCYERGDLGPNGGLLPLASGFKFELPSPLVLLGLMSMYPGFSVGLAGKSHRHGN